MQKIQNWWQLILPYGFFLFPKTKNSQNDIENKNKNEMK